MESNNSILRTHPPSGNFGIVGPLWMNQLAIAFMNAENWSQLFFHEKKEQACQLAVSAVIRNFYSSKPAKNKIRSVLVERLAYTLRVNIE